MYMSGTASLFDGMSRGGTAAAAGGILVVAGLIGAAATHSDGTRDVHRKYANDYQLQPTSKDAARSSIHFQRVLAGIGTVGGAALGSFALLSKSGAGKNGMALAGAAVLGASAGRLIKLGGAEEHLDAKLPEHTPTGESDMRRRNMYGWASDGAGYSSTGIYQGEWWGRGAIATGVTPPFGTPDYSQPRPNAAVLRLQQLRAQPTLPTTFDKPLLERLQAPAGFTPSAPFITTS
jgi:hypothetical protein